MLNMGLKAKFIMQKSTILHTISSDVLRFQYLVANDTELGELCDTFIVQFDAFFPVHDSPSVLHFVSNKILHQLKRIGWGFL